MPPSPAPHLSPADEALLAHENALDAADGITHHFAQVNGLRLHYASAGNPEHPLMLCLHGFPEFWYEWVGLMRAFAPTHHVVAPDLRGFNLSDKPQGPAAYRGKHVHEDLRQLITHLGHAGHAGRSGRSDRSRCTLVAHDWGGAIAWNFAAQYPELLNGLVAINAAHTLAFVRELVHDPLHQAASAYMLLLRSPLAEDLLARNGHAALRAMLMSSTPDARWFDAATEARYQAAWSQPGALTGGLNYYRATPMHPPTPSAPGPAALTLDAADFTVRVPTLVIWGERDPYLLPGLLDGLAAWVPNLQIVREPGSSHWIVHEQPDFVAHTVRGWLAGQPLAR